MTRVVYSSPRDPISTDAMRETTCLHSFIPVGLLFAVILALSVAIQRRGHTIADHGSAYRTN
jgi:hypothetical protein